MHKRFESPITGRFLSVDPVLSLKRAARSPQLWNRYAYVKGNPLRYKDPNGAELVSFNFEGQRVVVDRAIAGNVRTFLQAATDAGVPVRVTSSFRTTAQQAELYNNRAANRNPVAEPGTSSHESGLAIDLGAGGARPLSREQRQAVARAAQASGLVPFQEATAVHISSTPEAAGYESRGAAIEANQADADDIEPVTVDDGGAGDGPNGVGPTLDRHGSVFGNAMRCTRAGYGNKTGNFCG